ncbi:MAG: capsid assembly protein, partial [Limnohabitans sp.]
KFESTAQVVEAMSDPKYQADPAFRRKVQEKLARSNVL